MLQHQLCSVSNSTHWFTVRKNASTESSSHLQANRRLVHCYLTDLWLSISSLSQSKNWVLFQNLQGRDAGLIWCDDSVLSRKVAQSLLIKDPLVTVTSCLSLLRTILINCLRLVSGRAGHTVEFPNCHSISQLIWAKTSSGRRPRPKTVSASWVRLSSHPIMSTCFVESRNREVQQHRAFICSTPALVPFKKRQLDSARESIIYIFSRWTISPNRWRLVWCMSTKKLSSGYQRCTWCYLCVIKCQRDIEHVDLPQRRSQIHVKQPRHESNVKDATWKKKKKKTSPFSTWRLLNARCIFNCAVFYKCVHELLLTKQLSKCTCFLLQLC